MQVEWNNGALGAIFFLFALMVVGIDFIVFKFICAFPAGKQFFDRVKEKGSLAYFLIHLGLYCLCGVVTWVLIS